MCTCLFYPFEDIHARSTVSEEICSSFLKNHVATLILQVALAALVEERTDAELRAADFARAANGTREKLEIQLKEAIQAAGAAEGHPDTVRAEGAAPNAEARRRYGSTRYRVRPCVNQTRFTPCFQSDVGHRTATKDYKSSLIITENMSCLTARV